MTSDDLVEVYLLMTAQEMQKIANRAAQHGVSEVEFMTFCVRSFAFGLVYAASMLPALGQLGTQDEQE